MRFKEVMSWVADDKVGSTPAVVVVSDCGKVVKRLPYRKWNEINGSHSEMKEHIYNLSTNRGKERLLETENKYVCVSIKDKTYAVHRLVALAWIPNPMSKKQVNHRNGLKNDNRVENLEWMTNKENRNHAKDMRFERKSIEKVNDEQVSEMLEMRNAGMTCKDIASKYGIHLETVRLRTIKMGFVQK